MTITRQMFLAFGLLAVLAVGSAATQQVQLNRVTDKLAVAEADQEPRKVVPHDSGVEQQRDALALAQGGDAGIALARPVADDAAPGAGLDRPVEVGRRRPRPRAGLGQSGRRRAEAGEHQA